LPDYTPWRVLPTALGGDHLYPTFFAHKVEEQEKHHIDILIISSFRQRRPQFRHSGRGKTQFTGRLASSG
jgi:hypothetical protein